MLAAIGDTAVTALTPLQTYMFRHRAVTKAGAGAFRQPASISVRLQKALKKALEMIIRRVPSFKRRGNFGTRQVRAVDGVGASGPVVLASPIRRGSQDATTDSVANSSWELGETS
jgi:hypothetical protein